MTMTKLERLADLIDEIMAKIADRMNGTIDFGQRQKVAELACYYSILRQELTFQAFAYHRRLQRAKCKP